MVQVPPVPLPIGSGQPPPSHSPRPPGPRIVSAREAHLPPIRPIPPVTPIPHYRSGSSESSETGDRGSEVTLTEEEKALANDPVRRFRMAFMPYAAEFLGTTFFVMFGCGANAQFGLTSDPNVRALGPAGNWMTLSFGWGAGLAMGVWISGGGHLNPAVTLAMAVFRGFPWHRLPIFWFCQTLGGVVGAAIVYGNYVRAIDIFEGGRHVRTMATAGYFGTVPVCSLHPHKLLFAPWDSWLSLFPPKLPYVTNLECFFSEFTATALLVMGIFALFDQATHGMHLGIVPIGIFILFTGIAVAFGSQTSFAANPARDFGPRVFTAMVGYGRQVFTFRNWYFLYSPILGGLTGGLLGAALYDVFLYGDRLNIVNKLAMLRLGVVVRAKEDVDKV